MKICHTCKLSKSLDEFGNNKKNEDGKQGYCKVCGKEKDRKHYADNPVRQAKIRAMNERRRKESIEFICEYFKQHPCVDCGETNPVLLEFDHRGDKKDCVSCMLMHSRNKLLQEMEKCDVRCVRCHRLKTARDFGFYKCFLSIVANTPLS